MSSSSTQHTPGPWRAVGGKHGYEIQTLEPNKQLALTIVASQSTAYRTDDENRANARLISAAPEMLEVLKSLSRTAMPAELSLRIALVIAKVEGR